MNQGNSSEKNKWLLKKNQKPYRHFHLKTLFAIFLIIFCIDISSFNSITNTNSTNINKNNPLPEIKAIPKNSNPNLLVQPFLHPIAPPDYDTPYVVFLSWDQVINATCIQVFRSTSENYSAAVQLGSDWYGGMVNYTDSKNYDDGKILGNTYSYFIRAFDDDEGFLNSNWQNVTLPQVLFDQSLKIKFSDVIFTVKCNANVSELNVYYGVREEWGNFRHRIMESSNQKGEDGNYTFSKKVRIDSEGPLFYYYRGDSQAQNVIYLGDRNNPLISQQNIRLTTDHFKIIIGIVAIIANIFVYEILKKKLKGFNFW